MISKNKPQLVSNRVHALIDLIKTVVGVNRSADTLRIFTYDKKKNVAKESMTDIYGYPTTFNKYENLLKWLPCHYYYGTFSVIHLNF